MFPIDPEAPRPEIPHAERIFAASKELHDAYARGEEWTKAMPLHEAYVLFFLESISDAVSDLCERWHNAGRPGNFPDSIAVQHELDADHLPGEQPGTGRHGAGSRQPLTKTPDKKVAKLRKLRRYYRAAELAEERRRK